MSSYKRKYLDDTIGKWFRVIKNRNETFVNNATHNGPKLRIKGVKKDEIVIVRECVAKSCQFTDLVFVQTQIGFKVHILKGKVTRSSKKSKVCSHKST